MLQSVLQKITLALCNGWHRDDFMLEDKVRRKIKVQIAKVVESGY